VGGHRPVARNLLILLIMWELVGRFDLVASGALPAPSEIAVQFWADRNAYGRHVLATLGAASLGFLIGNLVALGAAVLFVAWPITGRLAKGVNVAIFAVPPIAIVPILVIAFSGMTPRVILAALAVYFPTMTATVVGLSQIDPRTADLVQAYGGGRLSLMRWVRLRSAMPALLGGLRVAAPNAVLGAILAEFGAGGRSGLGTYLLGSLGQANPARLWGIGLAATAIAGLAYAVFAWLGSRVAGTSLAVTIAAGAVPDIATRDAGHRWYQMVIAIAALLLPFLLWWLLVALLGISPIVVKTPAGVLEYLLLSPAAASAQARLLSAFLQTLPLALLGMAAGLAVAFLLAVIGEVRPGLASALLPVALITQTMPLVALTPLLVLLLGRGLAVTLAITISVTFFPAFVAIAQGLRMVPPAAFDLVRVYGARWPVELRLVAIPAALPYLFAAARLAVPRALLGVMIAEWLATGTGVGNLLNQSRGYLDYGMIWSVALVSILVAVGFYEIVTAVEARLLNRYGMRGR
jgi:ABC-type nitrate/sulfonate/bicarbonate transport system permease component